MKYKDLTGLLFWGVLLLASYPVLAQHSYSLAELRQAAQKNSQLLTIKEYQVQEKMSKLREDEVKRYPSAQLDGSYQYNFRLPDIIIPAGTIGSVTTNSGSTQLLPAESSRFTVGSKSTFNVGLTIYQPLIQQFKINSLLAINRTDIQLGQKEKEKMTLQLQLGVDRLYYGAIIAHKQAEAVKARLALTERKLYDAEGAWAAGKITNVNIAGLNADLAGHQQNLLRFEIQLQDYLSELGMLTGIEAQTIKLQEVQPDMLPLNDTQDYKIASISSPDMEIARLGKEKAMLGVKAAEQANLPDFGLVAGYYAQQGNPVLPSNSPFVGVSLKWNIQDLFTNKHLQNQREFQLKQAEENISYTERFLTNEIDKTWRKVKQAEAMIAVAAKVVEYRQNALKEQSDKQAIGSDIQTMMLETQSLLADAEADLYGAKLSRELAIAELRNLSGPLE